MKNIVKFLVQKLIQIKQKFKFGNFQNLPEEYVKDHIKVLGIY